MATISNNNIARAIYLASKNNLEDFPLKVVRFLVKKKLLFQSPNILSHLEKIMNEEDGKIKAEVWSVEKIDEIMKKSLENSLSSRYGGKKIILEEHLNPKLLGGFRIEINDEVLDLSLKNKINQLQEHLIKKQ